MVHASGAEGLIRRYLTRPNYSGWRVNPSYIIVLNFMYGERLKAKMCPICWKRFSSDVDLRKHLINSKRCEAKIVYCVVHTVERIRATYVTGRYTCNICGGHARSLRAVVEHIALMHPSVVREIAESMGCI